MFCAVRSEGKDVDSPEMKPSLASISNDFLMLVTFKVMFVKA